MWPTKAIQAGYSDVRWFARSSLLCTARAHGADNRPTPTRRQRGGGGDCSANDLRHYAFVEAPRREMAVRAITEEILGAHWSWRADHRYLEEQFMSNSNESIENPSRLTLVLGASGKTGRRITQRLEARGFPTRAGSRSGSPAFDWAKPEDWDAVLDGVRSVYISYAPDLAVPDATHSLQQLVDRAVAGASRA